MKSNTARYATALLATIALVIILIGCSSDSSVVAPSQIVNGMQVESNTGPVTILKMKPGSLEKTNLSTQLFVSAAKGGQLVVGNAYRGYSSITFAPNALPQDMTISLSWWIDEFFEGVFEPHGTQFNEPVRIQLSYKNADLTGINENELKIYYYNESTHIWEYIGGDVDPVNKVIVCYLEHFSRYAIVKT